MPVYEYLEKGRVVERCLPVEDRDKFPGRVTVPRRIRVHTRAFSSEGEYQAAEVLNGFRREEQRNPRLNDSMRDSLKMSPDQIKDAWAQPDTPYMEAPESVREGAGAL